jgi:hypothetical protein
MGRLGLPVQVEEVDPKSEKQYSRTRDNDGQSDPSAAHLRAFASSSSIVVSVSEE